MNSSLRFARLSILIWAALAPSLRAQYPNVRINYPAYRDPEEVSIAIDPTNRLRLAAAANIQYFYYSTDGGQNWQQSVLSSVYGVWGDPSVIYDRLGRVYFGHLSNPSSDGYWIDRIVVQTTTDGGGTWTGGSEIGYHPPVRQQDKEWLVSDMTDSPFRDRVYTAWTEFDRYNSYSPADSSRILFSYSTDHGQSWSGATRVSDQAGNAVDDGGTDEGAVPAVGPNGEVYLTWSGPLGIMFDKSTDGGVSFGSDIFVTAQPGGWSFDVPGIYRANGMPVTACDLSMSPYRGSIYVNWSDQRYGAAHTDIFFVRSTDGGESWSAPRQVNGDTSGREHFFSWMAVDQSNGYIYIDYYDRRNTTDSATDVYISRSTDGGSTFSDFQVSASSFTPMRSVFFGDYTNIAASYGHVYPVWMRLDGTSLSVWTAIVNDQAGLMMSVKAGWNMLSLPLDPDDPTAGTVFGSSPNPLFGYANGYTIADTLVPGAGYWYYFSSDANIPVSGSSFPGRMIGLVRGWNLVGSVSAPAAVADIAGSPGTLTLSPFYTYDGTGYRIADTLLPGSAYWVRTDTPGTISVYGYRPNGSARRIHIVASGEMPPPPPDPAAIAAVPHQFRLEQNYPNPFNPSTIIRYSVPADGSVSLKLFNIYGQEVKTLLSARQRAGLHSVRLDGNKLASGVYFYRLVTGVHAETKKMVLIR